MIPKVHWIEAPASGRLAIVARPRAHDWLDDEIAGWRTAGIDLVVSLLEPGEAAELGLRGEASLSIRTGSSLFLSPSWIAGCRRHGRRPSISRACWRQG